MTINAQFGAAQKSGIDTFFHLAGTTFEGLAKLIDLNLQTIKTLIGEAQETALTALSLKNAQELISLQSDLVKPAGEKAAAYGNHVREIVASTRVEFTKEAEAGLAEVRKTFLAAVDMAAKNAPAGAEQTVALLKTTVEAASNIYEEAQQAAQQAGEAAEAEADEISDAEVKSLQAIGSKARRGES